MTYRTKLIEVAIPLDWISRASAYEKTGGARVGHPSTIHFWWARRPLAAVRAVLFGQLIDDPSAWPDLFPSLEAQDDERKRLFGVLQDLVEWRNSTDERVINSARLEIARSIARARHASGDADETELRVLGKHPPAALIDSYLAERGPCICDPFAGGGSIPLEAQRLGLRTIAMDLNPVAVLINKAMTDFPARFVGTPPVNPESSKAVGSAWPRATGLAEDVRYYGRWMREEAQKRIGHLYPEVELPHEHGGGTSPAIAWLWTRTVASPNPAAAGAHVPLISTFWLSRKKGKETWIDPVVDPAQNQYHFKIRSGQPADVKAIALGTKSGRGAFVCLLTGSPISTSYIRSEGAAGRLSSRLLAVVAEGQRQRVYLAPHAGAEPRLSASEEQRILEVRERDLSGQTPARLTGGTCHGYGLARWADLFTPRQLFTLASLSDLVDEARGRILADAMARGMPAGAPLDRGGADARAYAEALGVYLAFGVNRFLNASTSICSWDSGTAQEKIRFTFARHALPMTWDFAEANPLSSASGNFAGGFEWIANAIERLPAAAHGVALAADATTVAYEKGVVIATDPPYYDNIGYADLSDLFYVWLRRSQQAIFPELFSTLAVPKTAELVATPHRFDGNRDRARKFFENGLARFFEKTARVSRSDIPASVFYAFKQTETEGFERTGVSTGWETMLQGLVDSGLAVWGTWPVRTELGNRVISVGTNALASSIVLVCRQRNPTARSVTRAEFRRALREELPRALLALRHGNIAPVDVAQAAIGPGMGVFSRYARVVEPDGSEMTVRAALQAINEVLDEYFDEGGADMDPRTRFAVTWFESHGYEAAAFGEAETLAKARNVSVDGVAASGLLRSAGGKVRLLKRSELPKEWSPRYDSTPTVWEASQHLIRRLEDGGEEAAATLLRELGPIADAARVLAYRLYNVCERKKWADEARAYNALVAAWPELEKLAARSGSEVQQSLL